MAEINDLNITDASNTARFPENMAPSAVNNGARALEGLIARWHKDTNGSVATTGAANTYAMAANQTLTAYYDGLVVMVDINATNTGASTLNVDALGAKNILKHNDVALASGDLEAGGKYLMVYDGTSFQLLSQIANAPAATGAANTFTADQTISSTDAGATEGPAIDLHRNSASPADADLGGVLRFKMEDDASNADTFAKIGVVADDVTSATEDGRLKIATIVAGTLADRVHIGAGLYTEGVTGGDKGAGTINAGTLYQGGTAIAQIFTKSFTSSGQTITAAGQLVLAHSLGAMPSLVQCRLVCGTGELGYTAADEVIIHPTAVQYTTGSNRGLSVVPDATNITIRYGSTNPTFQLVNKTTGAVSQITNANWTLVVRAWA